MAADQTNPTQLPTVNTYTYDNLLLSSTQPITTTQFRRHVYGYDGAGRKTSDHTYLVDQNGTVTADDASLNYVYYNDDRLSQRLGRYCCSDLISYQYDPAGHTTLATDNTNRPYTTPNQVFTYYLDGSLRSSQDMTYLLASLYSYDGSGNRVGRAEPVNGSSGRALTTYAYNDAGKMASMTSVVSNGSPTTFTYDLDGNLIQENDPNVNVLGLRYNHDSTLYSATLTNSLYTLASWIYAYDGDYRITSQTFSGLGVGGVTPVQGTASYSYDGAGRINNLTLPGQSGQSVSWDHDGNRLTYQGVTYTYNMDDSIATAGSTSFTYFPTGARRTDGTHFYCFDGYDRLFRATAVTDVGCNSPTISYAYEGLDRQRAHSEGSGTTFMEYDGLSSTISEEYLGGSPSGSGTVYALAGSRRTAVGSYASGGVQPSTINYLADEGHGNISTAVTSGGSMACTAWLDAWGVPMSPLSSSNPCNTGSTIDTSFYTGSRRDQITGDYQFGVRTYDPSTGSFLEPDTYFGSQPGTEGSVVSDPLTRNRYVYVNGDPLNLIDPSGHKSCRVGNLDPNCDIYEPVYVDHGQPGGGAYHIPYATCHAEEISSAECKVLFGPNSDASKRSGCSSSQLYDPARLTLSVCGVNLIAKFEGENDHLYNDPAGNCTIGIGHLVHVGACDGRSSEQQYRNGISHDDAAQLLQSDAETAVNSVRAQLSGHDLTQAQFDALVDFTLNAGAGSLAVLLTNGSNPVDLATVPRYIVEFVLDNNNRFNSGLKRRRCAEEVLFLTGNYEYETQDLKHDKLC